LYNTPSEMNITSLPNWNTFDIAQFTFKNINTTIEKIATHINSEKLKIKDVKLPTAAEIFRDAYHPSKSLSTAIHVLTWIVGIILFSLIFCCCIKTEVYRFCLTDITKCSNIKRRTLHKLDKRKKEHQHKMEYKKQVKVLKKEIKSKLNNTPTDSILEPLKQNDFIDKQLNEHLESSTPYVPPRSELTYVTIRDYKKPIKRYPDLEPMAHIKYNKDTALFEHKLLQTPSDILVQQPVNDSQTCEQLPPKKRKTKLPNLPTAPTS